MELHIYTDGGSKGNPGPAAIGFVIYQGPRPAGVGLQKVENEVTRAREDIGHGTNNDAEYTALIRALECVVKLVSEHEYEVERIVCHSDSELLVKQLTGLYKIKHDGIRKLVFRVRVLESELRSPVVYKHIPREQNKLADALVNGIGLE